MRHRPCLRDRLAGLSAAVLATAFQVFAAAPCRANVGPLRPGSDMEPIAPIAATVIAGTDAYVKVADTFDPERATDAALAQFGFPPRPDGRRAPEAYRAWRLAVVGMRRIVPVLQPVPIHHGPMRRPAAAIGNVASSSSNWSGYVAAAPAFSWGAQSMTDVYGDWVVPVAQTAFGACHRNTSDIEVYSSTWVGLDGNGSADVLQAGTESDAVCNEGQVGPYQAAWYEWYPYNEVRVTNLPVAPGSAMYVHVWASSATRGHAYIADKSEHKAVSIGFSAPPGTKLIGNSAEWVVERPLVNGVLSNLTNYVQEFFAGAQATDAAHNIYVPGAVLAAGQSPPLQIQMTNETNQVISMPNLMGETAIWFTDQGSALSAKTG